MTDPVNDPLGTEQPEADVLDQRRVEAPPTDPELEPFGDLPPDANEADVVEQHQVVPYYDEDGDV